MNLALVMHIVAGGVILNKLFSSESSSDARLTLSIVLATIDLTCLLPLAVASYFIVQAIKVTCNLTQYLVIKKISESTFDSRSTLIADKLKVINIGGH